VNPRDLVQALEPRWQNILDEVLRSMPLRATTRDVAKLAPKIEELSRAYNAAEAQGRRTALPLEARIAFSFPRDVPKGAGAVRELCASGALFVSPERPLRILDLGAGLGAMTWGVVRALAASGGVGRVEAVLVDEDPKILFAAQAIARAAQVALGGMPIELEVTTQTQSLGGSPVAPAAERGFDLVILGQVLSELDPQASPEVRLERQTTLVEDALRQVAADGALVIVEPALRDRTRHLHALRDRILDRRSANVFAPCLHTRSCPMLPIETEWCHEDLAVDLPPWVAPLARAAGLRWQGLTFSYLVLRKDGVTLAPRASEGVRFRVVSDLLRSKGKAELFICDEDGARRRIRRLDRDAVGEKGTPFLELGRGDTVTLGSATTESGPPIDERGRVLAGAHVAIDVGAARQ
jgi:ribosomal protein RSM22 (predicted rRNA methylase)